MKSISSNCIFHLGLGFVIFVLSFIFQSCHQSPSKNETVKIHEISEGTRQMIAMLQTIADTANPSDYFYLNTQHAEIIRHQMDTCTLPGDKIIMRGELAYELLQAGKTPEAINEFEGFFQTLDSFKIKPDPFAYELLGIAYMRKGEQQNCCEKHNAQSCIIPIKGAGIHSLKDGSEKAIALYSQILAHNPKDLQSRWLLNIAYMTVGKYPDSVPKQYFIPLNDSKTYPEFPHWNDVAPSAGVDAKGLSGGSCMEDFDHDGYLDIMCSSYGLRDQLKYFHNNGDGTFADVTEQAGLTGIVSGLNIIHADYNNDGWEDLLVLRGGWLHDAGSHPNSLLKNNGDGTFDDVTIKAGLLSFHPTQTASWADFNNDGWLDVFIGNESEAGHPHPCELYLNNKNGTFTNVAHQLKMDFTAFVKGAAWGDINNDGLPDLYCAVLQGKNKLFLNKGGKDMSNWKFEDISASAGVELPFNSFPCWFFDFNNDGYQDIFVSGYSNRKDLVGFDAANEYLGNKPIAETPRIYLNNKNNTFKDLTKEMGFENRVCYAMGSNYGDLDNDGWLDFYLGTGTPDYRAIVPNRMFHNDGGKFFSEVTYSGGFGHIQKGHGVSWGDIDNDGDQDIYMTVGGGIEGDIFNNVLFENPGNDNKWITLQLEGTTCNKKAIGARIKVTVTDTDSKQRNFYAVCSSGGSFGSNSLQQEIGLGKVLRIDSIEIIFPDGKNVATIYTNAEMNKVYKATQGKTKLEEVQRNKFSFGNSAIVTMKK